MMVEYLAHHGVKGMKWGVRKQRSSSSSVSRKTSNSLFNKTSKKKTSKKTVKKVKKRVKDLTEAELRKKIERLELEKKYKDLNNSTKSTGRKIADKIVQNSLENIGTQALTYGMGTAFNKMFKSNIVNPKKGQKDK